MSEELRRKTHINSQFCRLRTRSYSGAACSDSFLCLFVRMPVGISYILAVDDGNQPE